MQGRDNMPASGPLIVISNHLSNLDPPIVSAVLKRRPNFLAKKELFSNPAFAWFLRSYGAFPVHRRGADLAALNWGVARLKAGEVLVVFPEGTRSRGEGLLKGQSGAALLAKLSGATVLPMAITGSEPLQNMLRVFCPAARIRVVVGRPFTVKAPEGKPERDRLEKTTREMMARIASLLPESHRGAYASDVGMTYEVTEEA